MVKLNVREMSCGHCAASVQKAVRAADPAAEVDVDLKTGTVVVTSALLDDGTVMSLIHEAGYPNEAMTA